MSKYYKEIVGKRQVYRRVSAQLKSKEIIIEKHTIDKSESDTDAELTQNKNAMVNVNQAGIDNNTNCLVQNYYNNDIYLSDSSVDLNTLEDVDVSVEFNQNKSNLANIDDSQSNLRLLLRKWALKNKVSHVAVRDLLHILTPLHPQLPLDPRSLLDTPVTNLSNYKKFNNGEYCYFGIENFLQKSDVINTIPKDVSDIKISFNIDGLPLFHSSSLQFWPILGLIKLKNDQVKFDPFVIGIYCGKSKPEPLESYLKDFVTELGDLLRRGCNIKNKLYSIKVHSFVCDAPARAFIKRTKSHSGYSSCDKCTQVGTYYKNRVIFSGINAQKRTDESFALQNDEDHHLGVSPLLVLNIGLVSSFPIDYMHCICLGVVKKLITSWLSGNLNVRLSAKLTNNISDNLLRIRKYIPAEFNRKPRGLNEVSHWKATEFRAFLLYYGPIVLKNNINKAIYEHFLLLHFGISILCSKQHISTKGYTLAENVLINFVKHSRHIYGLEFLIYNIHLLLHITDDVKEYGPLDSFSTFPFENTLGQLKNLIRSPNKPLQQIHRRLTELNYSTNSVSIKQSQFFHEHFDGPLPYEYHIFTQYKKMYCNNGMTISISPYNSENCYCLLKDNSIVQINNIITHDYCTFLVCKSFSVYKSLYTYPFPSSNLNIFAVSGLSSIVQVVRITDILAKCMILPLDDKTLASFPLLHYT
ncbi:unnamed protein product [Psylliodes chrysocephalus]|uniref:Uncharacterized protein n=1 Tax=Psylliodes chrysocephalus TaxID=3402493 RepID=A0A9P0CNA8_9CUCU|nr:unnamed protein product [Psylliodes chrysocephala]